MVAQSPGRKITRVYIVALLLIGLLTISSQLLVRNVLHNQSSDARIINIAGRQRMLSQKITKTILIMYQTENEDDFTKRQKELVDIVKTWDQSHKALQFGDTSLQIPANNNSATIKKMFLSIEPHFLRMENSAKQLSVYNFKTSKEQFKILLADIIENEPIFLRIMNEITFQYDKEASFKIEKLKNIELVLVFITLFVLFLEAILVFRPAINKIDLYFEQVQSSSRELLITNEQLTKVQNEMRIYIDELQTTEEEIRQNAEELSSINNNLVEQQIIIERQKELITQRNRDITDSIEAAKIIQDGVLMEESTFISNFKEAFIFNKPKDIVSGDFYWFSEKEGKKIMVLGDCTGHGISGALMTMVGASILNEVVNENGIYEPDAILKSMDDKLRNILLPNSEGVISDGMDLSILVIENQRLSFAGASSKLYIHAIDEIKQIKGSSAPLGSFSYYPQKRYSKYEVGILSYHSFYIFSDGLKDQLGGTEAKKYGSKRFRDFLVDIGRLPMSVQKEKIEERWLEWKGDELQTDDILIIGLQC